MNCWCVHVNRHHLKKKLTTATLIQIDRNHIFDPAFTKPFMSHTHTHRHTHRHTHTKCVCVCMGEWSGVGRAGFYGVKAKIWSFTCTCLKKPLLPPHSIITTTKKQLSLIREEKEYCTFVRCLSCSSCRTDSCFLLNRSSLPASVLSPEYHRTNSINIGFYSKFTATTKISMIIIRQCGGVVKTLDSVSRGCKFGRWVTKQ